MEKRRQIKRAWTTGSGHENSIYELSGPPITYDDLAAMLSDVLGRAVPVEHVDDDRYAEIMAGAGVPEPIIPFLVAIQRAIREGALDVVSDDFEKLLGRPVTPVPQAIAAMVERLRG
ncbi:hypothetical protein GCM10010885_24240 [Alicyclobacillus cellulosilyticus]|uniref:Uncharacterized protein n=1 Tax=Alicyclobacillus cellulosilyticus TaxID=1003997 RepID=A0A917KJR5_9BACL|nr:hypothetical protein GCM10010885_24240 [Alicyclobacillus cellulosilyticus]